MSSPSPGAAELYLAGAFEANIGAVSALRETFVILAALVGFVVLAEGNPARRLLAAVVGA
ncbi:hypothetical protein GCM10007094_40620 [Pseudovibrio japonicus]|uniref:Uncharacterized protein n=1 Tax=Pseudovibrio japonicus TaxID=366534 RepID=A0ABQ3EN21_9HYPH|nr:hypothetical protein [Pseudovibrio japonicus]GHB47230.1 hypothetical protein GCM10007094_40620 [Pseudovibrio japonicus]